MNKPNNYEPIIPAKNEWEFVYNFVLEELDEEFDINELLAEMGKEEKEEGRALVNQSRRTS